MTLSLICPWLRTSTRVSSLTQPLMTRSLLPSQLRCARKLSLLRRRARRNFRLRLTKSPRWGWETTATVTKVPTTRIVSAPATTTSVRWGTHCWSGSTTSTSLRKSWLTAELRKSTTHLPKTHRMRTKTTTAPLSKSPLLSEFRVIA